MNPELSVVIPVRAGGNPYVTLASLAKQSYSDFEIIVAQDEWGNANKARNAGYALCGDSKYVLFSDDDIEWAPDAFDKMVRSLASSDSAYCYCAYQMGGKVYCDEPWSADALRRRNYISTMSVIRRECFPGWDEDVERLQDWALWLSMLSAGHRGLYCGESLFSTSVRDGITRNGRVTYEEAYRIVKEKHGS